MIKTIKNYLYNSLYQVFLIIVPFITIPYVSRVLGASLIGVNSYTNTIMSYFVLIANLGVTVYGNRTIAYCRDSIDERSRKFWEIFILKFLFSCVTYLLFLVFILMYPKYTKVLLIQSIQILAVSIEISWLFDGMEDFKRMVIRNFMVKIACVILIFIFVKTPDDFDKYVFITVFSSFLGNLTLWSYVKQYVTRVSFKSLKIQSHFLPVIYLFIPQITSTIFISINKLLLGNLSTMSQAGYFDNSDKIIRILLALITAVGTVIFPKVANEHKKRNKERVTFLTQLTFDSVNIITVPIVLGIISISSTFSNIFFGPNFKGIDLVLSVLVVELLFMGFSSVIGSQYLIATSQSRYLSIAIFNGVIVTVLSALLLIPHFGAVGASLTSVIGEMTIAFFEIWFVRKQINIVTLCKDIPKYVLSGFVMFAVLFILRTVNFNPYLKLILQIISGGIIYFAMIFLLKPKLVNLVLEKYKKYKVN